MQWLSFTKVKKEMLKLQNGWIWAVQRRWRLSRSFRRPETPLTEQGEEQNEVFTPLNSSKIQGKSCDETLAEASEPWPPQPMWANPPYTRCWGMNWGLEPFKMLHRQELTDNHVTIRVWKCRKILQEMADAPLPNLVFTVEKKNRHPAGGKPAK